MVVCCLRLAAAASATTVVALALLAPTAVVSFVTSPAAYSSLSPSSAGLRHHSAARFHCSFDGASRSWPVAVSSSRSRSIPSSNRESGSSGGRGRNARGLGVASLTAEVLPEGGVSPCIIKVSWLHRCPCENVSSIPSQFPSTVKKCYSSTGGLVVSERAIKPKHSEYHIRSTPEYFALQT